MPEIADAILLNKLRQEDSESYKLLYKIYFSSIASYIKKNSGNTEDAEDIFQEAIVVLLNKVRQPDFILTSSLKTYIFSISQNLWLKKLRNDKICVTEISNPILETLKDDDPRTQGDREETLTAWLKKITANCQQILKAIFFLHEPMDSLMVKMGWKNKHTATNQKYKCIEQVRKESRNSF